jgi:hypothetical protein
MGQLMRSAVLKQTCGQDFTAESASAAAADSQGGNLNTPRACASAFPCLVQQGLLFVKPEPLAKRPVSPARDSSNSSSSRPASGSNGDLHFDMHSHTGDLVLLDEVPVVAEFATEDWVVQDTWCVLHTTLSADSNPEFAIMTLYWSVNSLVLSGRPVAPSAVDPFNH